MIDPPRGPDYVQSLVRGLSVIRAFDAEHPTLSLSDVARATGLPRAAARRSLLTLVHLGYVDHADGQFSLRPRVLDLGYPLLSDMSWREVADPHLERLSAEVGERTSMCVLDGDDVVYIACVATSGNMAVSINVGTRFPAYATSSGRVLLADLTEPALADYVGRVTMQRYTARTITDPHKLRNELTRTRSQGWAAVDQELEEGLRALAAPVRSHDGHTIAALEVSAHASQAGSAGLQHDLLPPLLAAVALLEADLDAYPRLPVDEASPSRY